MSLNSNHKGFKWLTPLNSTNRCWATHANTRSLGNAEVGTSQNDNPTLIYKRWKNEFSYTNNVEYEFSFCNDDIKQCVSGNKKNYVVD